MPSVKSQAPAAKLPARGSHLQPLAACLASQPAVLVTLAFSSPGHTWPGHAADRLCVQVHSSASQARGHRELEPGTAGGHRHTRLPHWRCGAKDVQLTSS